MFYAIDFNVVEETAFPYAYTLYEPQGSRHPRGFCKRPLTQFVADADWDVMASWCEQRRIGPFHTDWLETEIGPVLAFELKIR
ncbi:hypothetical protein AFCDBAGC_5050 [Methylobacterium cerastii]|uniref:Uncharacterized protein n=1 Tax=Methylobacterium cerastii TaxID=932741 RepID=A0ABQ4QR36_9HYPH|nr:hypothetical protein [Methylobacterium cerastii]GJD47164.1 hypothetical protein AFCDBAGC_5050 [Methylobacterium cerastii]